MKKIIFSLVLFVVILLLSLFILTKKEKLNIYSLNIETEEIAIKNQIELAKKDSLEEKLKKVSETLSKENFDGRKIIFKEIKKENGNKIAYFDLVDTNEQDSWYPYFQGSYGAFSTKLSIVESLLQRDYEGKWIDGINLSYNGKYEEFDHINFENVIYWRDIKVKK